ncbi:helix-turn-helix domain-containing protein [Paenibacillus tengchongensis]|uniref:helix-turn-helix domain-containing protein n=1 Tax=Paenibacillus tengchongensis TaxID=2608684 RepID=UPI00124BF99E|nr:AraC family transcriptional regulator [Paenibacillus tengchongensis]
MGYYTYIRDTIDFIEEHLCEQLSLELISARLSFSPYHFHRVFHYLTGIAVMEYVRKRRLSLSVVWLASTDESIIDIAYKLQYQSPEAFTRAFKRNFGLSPSECRVKKTYDHLKILERLGEHHMTAMEFKGDIEMQPINAIKTRVQVYRL